jgi:hypothetical protein
MATAFLANIFDNKNPWKGVDSDKAEAIFKDLIADTVSRFDFDSIAKTPCTAKPQEASTGEPQMLSLARSLASFLCHCKTMGYNAELLHVVQMLNEKAIDVKVTRFGRLDLLQMFFLPLLKNLVLQLKEKGVECHETPFQQLFQHTLGSYVVRYVEGEPETFKDWARPTVVCVCKDCRLLNTFLSSPTEQSRRFARKRQRRRHLQNQLPFNGFTFEEDKRALVITKGDVIYHDDYYNFSTVEEVRKRWSERCDEARKYFAELPTDLLMGLLSDLYEPIISLSVNEIASKIEPLKVLLAHRSYEKGFTYKNPRIESPFYERQEPWKQKSDQLLITLEEEDLINFSDS